MFSPLHPIVYIYICSPPPRTYFFLFHWLFHCKVNHLLSAICQKNNNNTNTRRQKKTKTKKQQCIGEPSPLPRSQRRSPKTFFLVFFLFLGTLPFQNPTQNKSSKMFVCLFFLVWGRGAELIIKLVVAALIQINQDLSKPNLIHLASKALCVYQKHPSQTIIKQILYAKHAQVFLGDVTQFSFGCEAFGNVQFSLWWVKPFLQINGVPVIEGSWVSLRGVGSISKKYGLLPLIYEYIWYIILYNPYFSSQIHIDMGNHPFLVGGLEHGFYDFPYMGNFILPTDELSIIFQRGWNQPPTRLLWKPSITIIITININHISIVYYQPCW